MLRNLILILALLVLALPSFSQTAGWDERIGERSHIQANNDGLPQSNFVTNATERLGAGVTQFKLSTGVVAGDYFTASYVATTTRSPAISIYGAKTAVVDIQSVSDPNFDSGLFADNPLGTTGEIEVYGSGFLGASDRVFGANFYEPLQWVKHNAVQISSASGFETGGFDGSNVIFSASHGTIIRATGAYKFDVEGLRYLNLKFSNIGAITAGITITLIE